MKATIEVLTLDAPVLEERPWAVYSACRDADPEVFFASTRADERDALAVCDACAVADQCLEFAIETRERFGVWGGTNERERRKMLRA
jgi:WhiB family redox-sensing transcriptional regulator